MTIEERIQRYRAIETYRRRPLIVYATSTRFGVPAMMAGDSVREFIDQIESIPGTSSAVDVMINSMGGDALAAWKLMATLRERFDKIGVLVPFAAFSAATVFALGADEIIMHPYASLGPIDPQIVGQAPNAAPRNFAYEDLGAFLKFLRTEAGITEQKNTATVIDRLFSMADPLTIGGAKRASELSAEVGGRLLSMHLFSKRKAKKIAVNLNKSFFSHGDAVTRKRAKKLDLQIAAPNPALEKLIWDAYLGIESYMESRVPFNAFVCFHSNPAGAAAIATMNQPDQVDYSVVNAIVESVRHASEFRTFGKITGIRVPPVGEVRLNVTQYEARWKEVAVPATPEG